MYTFFQDTLYNTLTLFYLQDLTVCSLYILKHAYIVYILTLAFTVLYMFFFCSMKSLTNMALVTYLNA